MNTRTFHKNDEVLPCAVADIKNNFSIFQSTSCSFCFWSNKTTVFAAPEKLLKVGLKYSADNFYQLEDVLI